MKWPKYVVKITEITLEMYNIQVGMHNYNNIARNTNIFDVLCFL